MIELKPFRLPLGLKLGVLAGALWALCLLAGAPLTAQVNIEDLRPDDPPPGLSGSLRGDVNIQTGNVSFVRLGLEARVNRVEDSVHTLIVGDGGLGLIGSSRFASSGLAHYRETYWISEWAAPEWFGQINYDRSRLLAFRALAGAGVRSPTYHPEWGRIGGGTSLMLEHERFMLPDTAFHPERSTVMRSSTFLTLRAVFGDDGAVVVSSTTYIQPRLRDLRDVRLSENLSVATSVTEQVAVTTSFDLRYDSRPPDEVSSLDTRLRTGITLRY